MNELLSQKEANFLLEMTHDSLLCDSTKSLQDLIFKLEELIPFEHSFCLIRDLNPPVEKKPMLININSSAEWISTYGKKRYYQVDPIVKEHFSNFAIQYWSDTFKLEAELNEFQSNCIGFGLVDGYTYGVFNKAKKKGSLFSFCSKQMMRQARTEAILKF